MLLFTGKHAAAFLSVFVLFLAILMGRLMLASYSPKPDLPTDNHINTLPPCQRIDKNTLHTIQLKQLLLLKYRNEKGDQDLPIIHEVAGHWTRLCIFLGCNEDRISKSAGSHADDRCQLVLKEWLDSGGTKDYPASWNGLIKVLKDIKATHRIAMMIEEALEQCVY